ncbi:hypothetical protein BANRA_02855 [Escherichia coli]|nr:hypothetical protein BANRA_02855 [Escherichia coli]
MPLMQSLKEQGWFVMEQHLCLRKGGVVSEATEVCVGGRFITMPSFLSVCSNRQVIYL